jgi:hypothetical protein
VPFSWFTADEVYGQAKYLRSWLEERDVSYVMATRCSDTFTVNGAEQRADALTAAVAARSWQRLSAGAGAHGPREYHWTRIATGGAAKPGRSHWLLARRSLADPGEIAYYACYGPRRTRLVDLAFTAASRWHIEVGHRWHRSRHEVFSWLCSLSVAGLLFGLCPAGAGVVARRAGSALA